MECDIPEVTIEYPDGDEIHGSTISKYLVAQITFTSDRPMSFHTVLKISCRCGGYKEIKFMGCADLCSITTHWYTYKNDVDSLPFWESSVGSFDSTMREPHSALSFFRFPYFLASKTNIKMDNCKDIQYMQNVCDAVQRWVFTQVLNGKFFIIIPDQMNDVFINLSPITPTDDVENSFSFKKYKKLQKQVLVIIMLLVNLIGEEIKHVLMPKYVRRVIFMYLRGLIQKSGSLDFYGYTLFGRK